MDRETAVKIWQDTAFGSPDSVVTGRMIEAFANRVAEVEREACAKVAECFDFNERPEIGKPRTLPRYVAAAIRERSNKGGRGVVSPLDRVSL